MDKEVALLSFEDFRQDWILKHPASIPVEQVDDSPYPRWLKTATLLMFLSAAMLSAVHTIPVIFETIPNNDVVSIETRTIAANASIAAFELGILLSAFLMIVKSSERLAWVLLGMMFVGTVVANIVSISKAGDGTLGASIVTLIFGGGVPIIALAAGKLFVNIHNSERIGKKRGREEHREALKQLDTTINQAYSKYAKEVQKVVHSMNSVNERPAPFIRATNSSNGYSKLMNSRQIISEFFRQHPDYKNMTLDELNAAIERETGTRVGRTSIHNVRKEWEEQRSVNGNGHTPDS